MATTGLSNAYTLSNAAVDRAVTLKSPGAYALGNTRSGTFYVEYVGRSDEDINARLKNWVGVYKEFKYGYYPTAKAAFEKECRLFHDFGGLKVG